MSDLLAHRGPDASGTYISDPPFLGLGHRRLSVIDIEGGIQPMPNEDGSAWIAYNGEVYNYRELRDGLVSKGHAFKTRSDTEVVLHQYMEDGPACLEKFNGMFGLAVWDQKKRRLFVARDRIGIKPIYYWFDKDRFIFASELRPVLCALSDAPPIDPVSLWSYLAVQYVPSPNTMFRGIHELRPGHYLVVDENGVKEKCYWKLPDTNYDLSGENAQEAVRELLDDSVQKRLVADVPVGAFLSGGIDSTVLVAYMRRHKGTGLKTFSVDFHADGGADYVNETKWSSLAAKTFDTEHHALTITAKDFLEALPIVVERLDDLISDPAVVPTYLVSKFARELVTVVLSGEGGDELFAGYQRYSLGSLARYYQPVPSLLRRAFFEYPFSKLPHMRRVRKGVSALGQNSPEARHLAWLTCLPDDVIDGLVSDGASGKDHLWGMFGKIFSGQKKTYDLDRTLRADLVTWLPDDLLTKVDRASMAVGLEARVPYLDHRMVELSLRIHPSEKAGLFNVKKVFKKAMSDVIPGDIIKRKKAGFTLPLDTWFRTELKEMMTDLLSNDSLKKTGLFNHAEVEKMVSQHLSGRENMGQALFSLLIFQMWHKNIHNINGLSRPESR